MDNLPQNSDELQLSFEEAMSRLEEIVSVLEDGKHHLNETLTLYEEGVNLYRYCNEILDKSERRVVMLMQSHDGELDEVSFAGFEEE